MTVIDFVPTGPDPTGPDQDTPIVKYYPDGTLASIAYYQNDVPHDPYPGAPAIRIFHSDGTLGIIEHYQFGELHDPNVDVPAVTHFDSVTGVVRAQYRYQVGVLNDSVTGIAAVIEFRKDGTREHQAFHRGGLLNDPFDDSPAESWFAADDTIVSSEHFFLGTRIPSRMWGLGREAPGFSRGE